MKWLKRGVFVASLGPLVKIGIDGARGALSANPIAEILNRLGLWCLIFLLLTLACTPVKLVFRVAWPIALRRMLGLFAFTYGVLHLVFYVTVDQVMDLRVILEDLVKRKFITIGMLGVLLMLPLAVTSTKKMVRRLGGARWRALHRLVYLAGIAGIVHFVWRVKKDLTEPLIYASVLGVLLLVRIVYFALGRGSGAARRSGERAGEPGEGVEGADPESSAGAVGAG